MEKSASKLTPIKENVKKEKQMRISISGFDSNR